MFANFASNATNVSRIRGRTVSFMKSARSSKVISAYDFCETSDGAPSGVAPHAVTNEQIAMQALTFFMSSSWGGSSEVATNEPRCDRQARCDFFDDRSQTQEMIEATPRPRCTATLPPGAPWLFAAVDMPHRLDL